MDYRLPVKAVEQGLPAGYDGRARIMPQAKGTCKFMGLQTARGP